MPNSCVSVQQLFKNFNYIKLISILLSISCLVFQFNYYLSNIMAINLIYSFLLLEKMFFLFDQEAQENTLFMLFCLNENIIHIACVFLENSFCAFFFCFFFTVLYQDNLFSLCLVSRHFFITIIVSYVIVAYVSFFIYFF